MPPSPDCGPVSALHRRLDRLPPRRRRSVVLLLLGVVGGVAAVYLALVWGQSLVDRDPPDWTGPLDTLLIAAVAAAVGVWLEQRPVRGTLTRGQLAAALRDGRLPADADPELWALVLGDGLADLRAGRTAGLATMVVLAACAAGLALVVDPAWIGVLLGAAALGCAGCFRWSAGRRERRLQRLLDQLPTGVPPAG